MINTLASGLFRGFYRQNNRIEKQFFGWGCRFFVSDVLSKGLLDHLRPLHLSL